MVSKCWACRALSLAEDFRSRSPNQSNTKAAVIPGLAYLCVGVLTLQAWVGPMLAEDSRPIISAREQLFLLPCEPYGLNIITYRTRCEQAWEALVGAMVSKSGSGSESLGGICLKKKKAPESQAPLPPHNSQNQILWLLEPGNRCLRNFSGVSPLYRSRFENFWITTISFRMRRVCSQFVKHRWKHRRKQWHPTPVLSPGKSHGRRSLVGLQSMGSLRVGHDWATSLSLFTFMHWRRKWQPTPVFLPGESQGRGSLAGCRLWGCTESATTEAT